MAQLQVEAAALLFDMDGVLLSSIASAERCWQQWARHYGVPDWENFHIPHGMRAIELAKRFAPNIDPVEGLRFIEDLEIADVDDIEVFAGSRALLECLPKDRWTIVTSASRRLMEARVRAAKLPLPERYITADDVERGKPDPEPYRRGAELLGFAPSDCIVVEDAPSGIGAGLAAGCRVLGVVSSHTEQQVRDAGATWIVSSLADVERMPGEGSLLLQLNNQIR